MMELDPIDTETSPFVLGILGGGQLGQMTAMAAQRLGFRVHIYTPEKNSPASKVADWTTVADWDDLPALSQFARTVNVITLELESIPASTAHALQAWTPIFPQPSVLEIAQDRCREKTFLHDHGFPVTPFAVVTQPEGLEFAAKNVGFPLVLKTAFAGYDGKGQARVNNMVALRCSYASVSNQPCTLEKFVSLDREISVIAARGLDGDIVCYPPVENLHHNHILDITRAPAQLPEEIATAAIEMTRRLMLVLNMRGLLCVEFFLDRDGTLSINEIAPRPHNSGHYTIEASPCSQFEQLVRAVTGLPLGDPVLTKPAAMANLLGDLWENGEPNWKAALQDQAVTVHLYGKAAPRAGRKMGHITALADTTHEAEMKVLQARKRLTEPVSIPHVF
jgi:5-(carboxyamino)imidazole ribonucleotide synthase